MGAIPGYRGLITQKRRQAAMVRINNGKVHKKSIHALKVIQPDAAGIDLGSREHWVAGPPLKDNTPNVQRFGTTTPELLRLADWLKEQSVKTLAMESTGVYWIPLFEILASRGFEVNLVNARQVSHVPGRKTDMLDFANGSNCFMPAGCCRARSGLQTTSVACGL